MNTSPAPVGPDGVRQRRRWRGQSLLLALLCLVIYNANLRTIGSGDTLPARYLPLGLWRHGTVAFEPIARWVAHGHELPAMPGTPHRASPPPNLFQPAAYWLVATPTRQVISIYPIVAPLLVAPLYYPAVVFLDQQGWPIWQVEWVAAVMEKLSASLLATLAVVVVFRLLRREAGPWSWPLTVAFAFGTNTWMTSSQALWQHGAGELMIALALLLLTGRPTPARWAAVGALCVAMAASRPPNALIAAAIGLYVVWTARSAVKWLVAGGLLPASLVIAYNVSVTGHLLGGYGTVEVPSSFFAQSLLAGLAGELASPAKGLLVFSPFLLFVPVGLAARLRTPGSRALAVCLAAGVAAQLLFYAKADWRAGFCFGPRWLTDMLPILVWLLAPVPRLLTPIARLVLGVAMAASIAIQTIGAFWYMGSSDKDLYLSDGSMRGVWTFANAPFVAELKHPREAGDLACSARGYLDRVGAAAVAESGAPVPVLAPGVLLEGWALGCGRTPAEVLLLADGLVIARTREFSAARPDVAAAMGSTAASSWRLAADTRGLAPGEHVLAVAVYIGARSDLRIVSEHRVRVASPGEELAFFAARAAAQLRARQNVAGYWLTAHTNTPRLVDVHHEMNTFLTAMLVDLLSPVASRHGLEEAVARARRHLGEQIEANGLVRYHGRPDGPTIGTLGCVITPDADDTALAWRIASPPASDPRRASMLEVLRSYRDARGFYRTWLAPTTRYECLNPGRDPNPADLTIQLHVLMLLAEVDPDAAHALCSALAGAIDDESLSVYYARAPIVPLLRSPDLRRAGCALEIPRRRRAGIEGQERWIAAAERLSDTSGGTSATRRTGDESSSSEILAAWARDDFAELRRTPPLLYHNDFTASVSRYYWSEDFGYALWLRLYEAERSAPQASGRPR